jgi:hypothetical protein
MVKMVQLLHPHNIKENKMSESKFSNIELNLTLEEQHALIERYVRKNFQAPSQEVFLELLEETNDFNAACFQTMYNDAALQAIEQLIEDQQKENQE